MSTTITQSEITTQAKNLDNAEQSRQQIKPVTISHPHLTIKDAYHIQNAWIQIKLDRGHKVIGHKVGLTSRVMQEAMNINEPDFGILLDNMVFPHGSKIEAAQFTDPRIEVEIAFVLGEDLNPNNLTIEKVLKSTKSLHGSLELIAARSYRKDPKTGYTRTVKDTISDNAANAGILLSNSTIPHDTDLSWIGAVIRKNGIIEESGISGAVLDHPANGVIWLAQKYASIGRTLKAGEVILSGSFTRPIVVEAGDVIEADFNRYGIVGCTFI